MANFCPNCGNRVDGAAFCSNCGTNQLAPAGEQQPQQAQRPEQQQFQQQQLQQQCQQQNQGWLVCPWCGGTNIQVQIVEKGQMTTKKGVGFGGHVNNTARGMTAIATLGVSNLFWKKSKGTNKTRTINATMGICQGCGCTWEINSEGFGIAPGSIIT